MSRAPSGPAGPPWRRVGLVLVVAAAVLVVVGGAVWSLARTAATVPVGADELAVPGGLVRVDRVLTAEQAMAGMAMPGMGTDADPVPEGEKRVSVDVTVLGARGDGVAVDPDAFTLEAPGAGARPPHRSVLPTTTVPAGSRLSGTLVFDVPADATTGVLGVAGGGALDVPLPAEDAHDPSHDPSHGPSHAPAPSP
ncbi:hypothetical protein [Aquipuribacter nitratireducens]|uniref:DUF4352 domain-containing protein n=1 Tax=Aquipuribacter nitratireducens TaxID=650104 RepID=A0ABW0GJL3_9MICO